MAAMFPSRLPNGERALKVVLTPLGEVSSIIWGFSYQLLFLAYTHSHPFNTFSINITQLFIRHTVIFLTPDSRALLPAMHSNLTTTEQGESSPPLPLRPHQETRDPGTAVASGRRSGPHQGWWAEGSGIWGPWNSRPVGHTKEGGPHWWSHPSPASDGGWWQRMERATSPLWLLFYLPHFYHL